MHAGLQTTHIYLLSGESETETTLARQEHHFDILQTEELRTGL